MKVFKKVFWLCCIMFVLLATRALATEGDVIEFNGITTTMPEILNGIDSSEEKSPTSGVLPARRARILSVSEEKEDENSIDKIISKFGNETTAIGIDISHYQGDIDWKQVAASGIKFAMIKCGGRGYGSGALYSDPKFAEYMKGAKENGIYVGVYFYSAAINEEEALQEAVATVEAIKGYDIQYPVVFDYEEFLPDAAGHRSAEISKEQLEKNTKVFLEYVSLKGYQATLYSSANFLNSKWNMDNLPGFGTWVAHWGVDKPNYARDYQLWQYTDSAIVPGISTKVDVNIDYCYWKKLTGVSENTDKTDTTSEDKKEEEKPIDWSSNPPTISVTTHVQDFGWMGPFKNEEIAGTTGKSKRLEAIKLNLTSNLVSGGLQYRGHVQDVGWENGWRKDGEVSGSTGMSRRVEAFQMKLTGELANYYDIYYRVHVEDYGWLGWAKNGESAGTEGLSKRLEAIQVKLVLKTGQAPSGPLCKFINRPEVKYRGHVEDIGWMSYVTRGIAGTTGLSKRVEAMNIYLSDNQIGGGIEYRSHVEKYGWENNFVKDNSLTGTTGEAKRLEAIQIRLYGAISEFYDVYYRVHVQDIGWMNWVKNGEVAGTTGMSKRLEAIEIQLVPKK
ncbi:MAG: hypothetical protein IJ867_07195 [Clostridia bacterium]|nr:hypothetical protein [Clostridia bacterium]